MNEIVKFGQHKSQIDIDEAAIEAELSGVDSCIIGAATRLNSALDRFWSFPDDRIEAILNHYGPVQVEAIFTQHAEKATMINALLAARGIEPQARVGAPREIVIDQATRTIKLKPQPVPEPVPGNETAADPEGPTAG